MLLVYFEVGLISLYKMPAAQGTYTFFASLDFEILEKYYENIHN